MNLVELVLAELGARGLLLGQDPALPSVVGIITGEPLRGSWWTHPQARVIYAAMSALAAHPDVLVVKLLLRKDTLVHRSLWPALLAVVTSREPWQLRGLSAPAKRLIEKIDLGDGPLRATGPPVKELRARLLANAEEVHTDSGRHELLLEAWPAWSARVGCAAMASPERARATLEAAAAALGAPPQALPWRAVRRA
jgi:hypothetical protein